MTRNEKLEYKLQLTVHAQFLSDYFERYEKIFKAIDDDIEKIKTADENALFSLIGGGSLSLIDPTLVTVPLAWGFSGYVYLMYYLNRDKPPSDHLKRAYDDAVYRYEKHVADIKKNDHES